MTAPEYILEGYEVEIIPQAGMLAGTLACWFMRKYIDNIFGLGVSGLVCVVNALFSALSLLHGHNPIAVASLLVMVTSGIVTWYLFTLVRNQPRLSDKTL